MQNDSLLKVLGWQAYSPSDDTRTLRHYRQFPDPQLATCLHHERVKHEELLNRYPDLKDPVIRISHAQLPRLQNMARRIQLMEQIQAERIAVAAQGIANPVAEFISAPPVGADASSAWPMIGGVDSRNRDAETRFTEQDGRPSEREYFDPEHERHVKLWKQVKSAKSIKLDAWLHERVAKFSKTTFTDYLAGRMRGRVSRAKRFVIEEEIRHSVEPLGPTRTNSD